MADLVSESSVFPVNELGEIILTQGIGSSTVAGFISSRNIPSDVRTGAVRAVFIKPVTETVAAGTSQTFYLQEGKQFIFTPSSATGTIVKYLTDGTTVDFSVNIGNSAVTYGTFIGTQKFVVTVTTGTISIAARDASLGAVMATSRYKLGTLNNRHIRKMSGSFSVSANAVDVTHNVSVAADQSFEWVRLWIANSDTANQLTGIKGLIAATETAADLIHPTLNAAQDNTIQAIGALTGWNAVTWDGGSATTTVPVAAVASGATPYQVTYKASDWMRRRSVPRADGGVLPIALGRVLVPSTCNTMTLTAGVNSGWAPTSGRFFKGSRFNVDGVSTTPANYTTTGEGSTYIIAGMEFRGSLPTCSVMFMGDSTYAGYGLTPALQNNWAFQCTDNLAQLGYPVSMVQGGWTGTTTLDYYNHVIPMIVNFKPSILFYEVGSSNDGTLTQSQVDRMFAQAMDLADYCALNGTVCVFTTMIPNNSTNTTTDALRLQLNNRILASNNPVVDMGAVLSDGASPARIKSSLSQGDGTPHPNAAGHAAMQLAAQTTILQIINSNAGAFA